jgi:hypothetical protein
MNERNFSYLTLPTTAATLVFLSGALNAQVDVLTAQYGNGRTSANMHEQVLNVSNVNAAQFGHLFSLAVDGPVYALPLVVTQFNVPAVGLRDLVIVATLSNSVYAFDADNPAQASPYWHVNLGTPHFTGSLFLGPTVGILATPVIDRTTSTIYLTATINNSGDIGCYLFALDLATGNLKFNAPQRAVLPLADGVQATDATNWYQRAGLLLSNNTVYTSYTYVSNDGLTTEHGFVQAFQANDLSVRTASWESSPNTPHGGVWQAGRGLAADENGNLFIVTADGELRTPTDFGNSVVELTPVTLSVENYFTPSNWLPLFKGDVDLGANSVTLIPNTNLAFTGGKQGVIYLLSQTNLGGLQNLLVPIQAFQATNGCGLAQCGQYLSTAYWANATNPYMFVWDKLDHLRAYPFDPVARQFETANTTTGTLLAYYTGGIVVTSNGSIPGTGVLWAFTADQNSFDAAVPGTLRAYDPTNITNEIYDSDQAGTRDTTGSFVKFLSPVVANGRVYQGNQSGTLQVYGLLCQANQTPSLTVTRGPFRTVPKTTQYTQQITFTNNGATSIGGPFSVAFEALPSGITVMNPNGATSCAAPAGSPWVAASTAPLWLQPGQSFSVTVTFNRTGSAGVAYTPTVLAGSGGQ